VFWGLTIPGLGFLGGDFQLLFGVGGSWFWICCLVFWGRFSAFLWGSFFFEILVSRTLIVYENYKKCIRNYEMRAYKMIGTYRYFYSLVCTII